MAQKSEQKRGTDLRRIASALERIEEEDFGYCAVCGAAIDLKRLESDPAVTTCIACARK